MQSNTSRACNNREYKVDPTRVSITARKTEIKNKPVTKLQNPMLVFEGECQKYITKNKYTMYETPVKLKDPFPWINWHSKTNRTAKSDIKTWYLFWSDEDFISNKCENK